MKEHSEHNREVADGFISYSNELIIFTADSSKLSSIAMFCCTYKLFFDEVTRRVPNRFGGMRDLAFFRSDIRDLS